MKEIENNISEMDYTTIRVGEVSMLLTQTHPSIIPFKGAKFPLVPVNEYAVFLDETLKQEKFEDLPKFMKQLVYTAEEIKEKDEMFRTYLNNRGISAKEFVQKNPKTKLDILYDWLFSEQLDVGVLDL